MGVFDSGQHKLGGRDTENDMGIENSNLESCTI